MDEVYSVEGGWSGWAAGEAWGYGDSREGVFPLAVADRFLLVTEPLLRDAHAAKRALLCNGDSMLLWCIVPLPPPATHLSGMVPLPPAVLPNHDAVGRAVLSEDDAYGVAHSDVVWVHADTGAALYVGSSAAALDMAFLRRRK